MLDQFPQTATVLATNATVLRLAIDNVTTLRAAAMRIALYATLLCRSDPVTPDTAEERDTYRTIMSDQVDRLIQVCEVLENGIPFDGMPSYIARWLNSIACSTPNELAIVLDMRDQCIQIRDAIRRNAADQHTLLRKHRIFGRGPLFDAVTTICDAIWRALEREKECDLDAARKTADALSARLARLDHIGKHVRLVSLNAAVEAARIGEDGRGLGVIAHEFKTLAEEIQVLARAANMDQAT